MTMHFWCVHFGLLLFDIFSETPLDLLYCNPQWWRRNPSVRRERPSSPATCLDRQWRHQALVPGGATHPRHMPCRRHLNTALRAALRCGRSLRPTGDGTVAAPGTPEGGGTVPVCDGAAARSGAGGARPGLGARARTTIGL